MGKRSNESEATVIEGTSRPAARGSFGRTLLALVVSCGAVLLTLSFDPARAATTFTVTETGDDRDINLANSRCDSSTDAGDQCTLRAAIEEANDTAGKDTIDFDIGGTGAKTISPTSAFPTIDDTVTIDGYTQAGASPNTLAEGNDAVLNVMVGGLSAGVNVDGFVVRAPDCTIKGLVIKNFDGLGVQILGAGSTGNRVEGNFIGVNRDGLTDRGNTGGVFVESDSNTIGGTAPGSRNVISGNDDNGLFLGVGADSNRVEGNYIGTTADGSGDLDNTADGVLVGGASNTIGGRKAGAGNVISGNGENGVAFDISAAVENRVEGNFIGTAADGSGVLGNTADGVSVQKGAELTAVGGTRSGAPNRIAHNGGDGVSIEGNGTRGTNILSNRIFDNDELGIDLEGGTEDSSGVTDNDTGDADAGPNNLQNFPTIIMARRSLSTGLTTITGRLNRDPTQDYVVQCFLTDGSPASAHGEGSRLLGTDPISVGDEPRFSCETRSPLLSNPGQTVSATATNVATGDTSEFSKNRTIATGP